MLCVQQLLLENKTQTCERLLVRNGHIVGLERFEYNDVELERVEYNDVELERIGCSDVALGLNDCSDVELEHCIRH